MRRRGHRGQVRFLVVACVLVGLCSWGLSAVPPRPGLAQEGDASDLGPLPSEPAAEPELEDPGDFSNAPPVGGGPPPAIGGGEGFVEGRSARQDQFTTPTQEVFANPDGTQTLRVSSVPTRFEDATGAWRDIDLTLQPAPDGGFVATASPLAVTIPGDPAQGLARYESPLGPFVARLPDVATGAAPAKAEGDKKARFESAAASVDVALTVHGFEQDLVLASTAGPSSYRLAFDVPAGVSARDGAGGVEFVAPDGAVMVSFGGGVAHDSAGEGPGKWSETPVTTRLVEQVGASATVEVSVDAKWLADGKRVAPIVIDPTFYVWTLDQGYDTTVDSFTPDTSYFGHWNLRVGDYPGASDARALLYFNLQQAGAPAPAANVGVSSAKVSLYNWWAASTDAKGIAMHGLGGGFGAGTTWSLSSSLCERSPVSCWSGDL